MMIEEEGNDDIMMIRIKNNIPSHSRKKYRTDKSEANVKQQNESLTNYYFQ
jgi:hypothetical protein